MTRFKFVAWMLSLGLSFVDRGKPPPKRGRPYGQDAYGVLAYGK
jgi:hypothetical protein